MFQTARMGCFVARVLRASYLLFLLSCSFASIAF